MPLSLGRAVLLIVICSLISVGFSVASAHKAAPRAQVKVVAPEPARVTVPDVRGQAYVFAKGDLETAGFAWKLAGRTPGYAAMIVADQKPAPGTLVVDTGYPTLTLELARPQGYVPRGQPQQASSYPGSALELAQKPIPAQPAAARSPVQPARVVGAKAPAAPKLKAPKRPPAFHVSGARREPLDEMPLPDRARLLSRWLSSHPKPTAANQRHWLYQHAWVVSGARFGWWQGAQALRILIRLDERVQALWGIGARSEADARVALRFVEARTR